MPSPAAVSHAQLTPSSRYSFLRKYYTVMANSAEELIKFYKDESSFAHLEGAWRALWRWMGPCRTCTCMYGDKSNLTRSFLNPSTGAATLEDEGVTGLEAIKGKIERLNLPGVVVNFGSVDVQSSIDGACASCGVRANN